LIRRSWHDVLTNHLRAGHCPHCHAPIPGVWSR
jgi:hypothetical protein